jgi:RNA polymerase sigma-70 factor (ECF subfamily)
VDLVELRRRLLGTIRRVCPSWLSDHAEDIAQEAMIKVTGVLQREGERDRSLPASYLNKVAYHATVDAIRRHRQRRLSEVAMENGLDGSPEHAAFGDPEKARVSGGIMEGVQQCLEDLVESRRLAVILRLQGHSVPEIASLLGWPQTRANNLVFRGMKDLKRCLAKKGLAP